MATQNIDYTEGVDTGERNPASIQPIVAGEPAGFAVIDRPLEALRGRTEIVRTSLEEDKYLNDADRATLLTGGGNIAWNSSTGKFTISSTLVLRPFLSPPTSTPAKLPYGTFGSNQVIFTTYSTFDGVVGPPRSYDGANKLRIKVIQSTGASLSTAIYGADSNYLAITLDSAVVTASALITFMSTNANCLALGIKGVLESTSSGSANVIGAQAEAVMTGATDAEQHWITSSGLAAFFTDAANNLASGDTLCIYYPGTVTGDEFHPGRRESIIDSPENSQNADGNLFKLSRYPEKLPYALPICTVDGTTLVFINNLTVLTGTTVTLSGAFVRKTGDSMTGPLTVAVSTGNTIAVAGTGSGTGVGVSGTGSSTGSVGVQGTGTVGQPGVLGTGGAGNSVGVRGIGVGSGSGVSGMSSGTGVGVFGQSAASTPSVGVSGLGTTTNTGVLGTNSGTGIGVSGVGGGSGSGGIGVQGSAGGSAGIGVKGIGAGAGGVGVRGDGGTSGGTGVVGNSSTSNGGFGGQFNGAATATGSGTGATGAYGQGNGVGQGLVGVGGNADLSGNTTTGNGVQAVGGSNPAVATAGHGLFATGGTAHTGGHGVYALGANSGTNNGDLAGHGLVTIAGNAYSANQTPGVGAVVQGAHYGAGLGGAGGDGLHAVGGVGDTANGGYHGDGGNLKAGGLLASALVVDANGGLHVTPINSNAGSGAPPTTTSGPGPMFYDGRTNRAMWRTLMNTNVAGGQWSHEIVSITGLAANFAFAADGTGGTYHNVWRDDDGCTVIELSGISSSSTATGYVTIFDLTAATMSNTTGFAVGASGLTQEGYKWRITSSGKLFQVDMGSTPSARTAFTFGQLIRVRNFN